MNNNTNHNDTDDESELFRQEMAGVRPLRQYQARVSGKSDMIPEFTHTLRRQLATTNHSPPADGLSDACVEPVEPEQPVEYRKAGLQHGRFRQLKQGRFPVNDSLDLHGCTISEARNLLIRFLNSSQERQYSCVRIIHGKSHRNFGRQDTMKSHVNRWLRQIKAVQAFCSCLPRDGGCGAVYVLLKTHR